MNPLNLLIGLICLMPKVSLCFFWPFVGTTDIGVAEYWEEKCRIKVGKPKYIAMDAKWRLMHCFLKIMKEEKEVDIIDEFGKRNCMADQRYKQCVSTFFEDLSPCLNEGEAKEMMEFLLKVNFDIYKLNCDGSWKTWMKEVVNSDAYHCIEENLNKRYECQISGRNRQHLDGLIEHARGESIDSITYHYCGAKQRYQQCLSRFFEDVSPCLNEGEAKEMMEFLLKLNLEIFEFSCDGTWMNLENGYEYLTSLQRTLQDAKKIFQRRNRPLRKKEE